MDNFDLSYSVARILLASCKSWIFKALNIGLNQLLFLDFRDVKVYLLLRLRIMFESDAHLWKKIIQRGGQICQLCFLDFYRRMICNLRYFITFYCSLKSQRNAIIPLVINGTVHSIIFIPI